MNLVVVDALSRSFADGCGNRVDVRGGALAMERTGPKNGVGQAGAGGLPQQRRRRRAERARPRHDRSGPRLGPQTVLATNGEYTLFVIAGAR
jgi:hypothetical protein